MMTRRDMLALSAASALPGGFFCRCAEAAQDTIPFFTGDKKPEDPRLGRPKTLDDSFPFVVPETKEAWEVRRKQLREQLLVANGLWPMPQKTPLEPVVHGKIDRGDYTIEKVYFASTPGHYVCGNLYRPSPVNGPASAGRVPPRPGVLFAHGHWAGGRFEDAGQKAGKVSVDGGGEPDIDRGRYFMQAIPATLARLGFVVFQYDMIGYADSTAIPHREGFKDADAELRLQSQMGLQTWNSIRALDFLVSLPNVDQKRLGMTGASGGGTQTFIMAALDDRLAAAFPAVMVSTGMQGGCVCENCSLLRVNTGNVEIAGLFAPKPMAFSAANDWTKEFMTKGFPELQQLYDLYGAKDKVAARAWLEYGHQYNVHARQFMYGWFLKHLMGKDEQVKEPPFKPVVPVNDLSVFDKDHPRPKAELDAAKLREAMAKASDEQMKALEPKDAKSLAEFKRAVGTALRVMVNDQLPDSTKANYRIWGRNILLGDHTGLMSAAGRSAERTVVPSLMVWTRGTANHTVAIWLHPKGKASLTADGQVIPAVRKMTTNNCMVLAPDLFGIGEMALEKPHPINKTYAGFTYGYNRTLLANRVHDVLTLIAEERETHKRKTVHLIGFGEMGPVAILAKALAGDAVGRTVADMNQFRFENVKDAADPMMLPGAVKYGGMGAFLALCAPGELLTYNHKGTGSGQLSQMAYKAAGAQDKFTHSADKLDDMKVAEWLLK